MRILLAGAALVASLLLVVGIAAPFVAKEVATDVLATLPGYVAEVGDADVSLLGGSAAFEDVSIARPGIDEPFVSIERLEARPHLGALLRGDRIADVTIDGLVVNYVLGVDEAHSQTAIDAEWLEQRVGEFPSTLDRLTVRSGAVHYRDHAASPDVHVVIDELEVDGANLANLEQSEEPLFGRVEVRGRVEEHGRLTARVALDPYAGEPRFEVDARVEGVPLARLDDLLRAYAKIDAEGGTFSVVTHLEARDGAYAGVARPEVEDLEVRERGEAQEDGEGPLRSAWEAVVGAAGQVAEAVTPNERGGDGRDEIELEVRFDGVFGDQPALVEVLEALPAAWFGALTRALHVGGASAEEAIEGAVRAGEEAARERGDDRKERRERKRQERRSDGR